MDDYQTFIDSIEEQRVRHFREAVRLLRNLVDTARPALPKTPFKKALDEATEFLQRKG